MGFNDLHLDLLKTGNGLAAGLHNARSTPRCQRGPGAAAVPCRLLVREKSKFIYAEAMRDNT